MTAANNAIAYTRQHAIRATIQSVIWLGWAAALVWYGRVFWAGVMGTQYMSLETFLYGNPADGWLGAIAAYLAVGFGVRGISTFVSVSLPFIIKRRTEIAEARRMRRRAQR